MRISEFFNAFQAGSIPQNADVPFNALELYDLLAEYIASIKMHRASLAETEALKKEVQSLKGTLYKIDMKLSDALSAERIQRTRAARLERESQEMADQLKRSSTFQYSAGDIFSVIR